MFNKAPHLVKLFVLFRKYILGVLIIYRNRLLDIDDLTIITAGTFYVLSVCGLMCVCVSVKERERERKTE